jgi:hypothetical protein
MDQQLDGLGSKYQRKEQPRNDEEATSPVFGW